MRRTDLQCSSGRGNVSDGDACAHYLRLQRGYRCAEFPNADGKPILFLTSDEFFCK